MSCSRVRRELLEQFRFPEELGPRSGPHLAHLESCAECRREVGIDLALVGQLRRALRERVEGSAPSPASWELVRRRTVDRAPQPWTFRVLRWGGMLPAAAAGIMMFAIATTSQPVSETQALASATPSAERVSWSNKYRALDPVVFPPYGLDYPYSATDDGGADEMGPIPGRMQ